MGSFEEGRVDMTKLLRSRRMRDLLAEGVRKSKRMRPPSDGTMTSLVYLTLKNGWHYQVEWVHDQRFQKEPWIIAYAFPPHHPGSVSAPYYLVPDDAPFWGRP